MNRTDDAAELEAGRQKLAQLTELLRGRKTFLAQTHDYPDPDTLAAAVGLAWLVESLGGLETVVGYGGVIGRAENRAMVKVLGIKMRKLSGPEIEKFDVVALLDTQPDCHNHSLPDGFTPDIVVDHHFERELAGPRPAYFDVGGSAGTTSTKVTELIRASGLIPPPTVATALFYGVKSDTLDLSRIAKNSDVGAYLFLFDHVDRQLLTEIEHPQVPLDYFRVLNQAIEHSRIYGSFVLADLGHIYTPDLCAEIADQLLHIEGIKHALATGWYEGALHLSLRTRSKKLNIGRALHELITKEQVGSAGGHPQMAGARLPVEHLSIRERQTLRRRIVRLILEVFGEDPDVFQAMLTSGPLRAKNGVAKPSETASGRQRRSKAEVKGGKGSKVHPSKANGKRPLRAY